MTISREVLEKIEAAAEKYAVENRGYDCYNELTGKPEAYYMKMHNSAGATHILNSPRDFGLVPESEVEALIEVSQLIKDLYAHDITQGPMKSIHAKAVKALEGSK